MDMVEPDESMEHQEEYVGFRPRGVGPIRPRRYRQGDKVNRGCSTVGLSTKRMKAEVDTVTQQKGRTTNLPEDFVTGYYPNDDFDCVRRDVKSWSENPVNSLGGGFEVVRGKSYPTGGDVHGHKSLRSLKCKVIGCN